MKEPRPFGSDRDEALARALAGHFAGPDETGYVARLSAALATLPERDSQWDVLAGWARPSVVAAAMAAGFVLGIAIWQGWRQRNAAGSPVSVAMLEASRPAAINPIINVVLEDR